MKWKATEDDYRIVENVTKDLKLVKRIVREQEISAAITTHDLNNELC